jgi:hypothetical protein
VSAIFLIKISKRKIRTANPSLSANVKRFDLAVIQNMAKLKSSSASLKDRNFNLLNQHLNYKLT